MERTPGTVVSAVGHTGLIGWLILGWGFSAEPLPFEVSNVSVVSSEEYAAAVARTTLNPDTTDPDTPTPPAEDTPPPTPVFDEPTVTPDAPTPVEPPVEDTPPPQAPEITPPTEAADTVPEQPAPPPAADDLPPSDQPAERPTDRIAAEAIAPPPPDADIAPDIQETSAPDQTTEAPIVEEPVEETAPEETATQITPEDVAPSGAVETSIRPAVRPQRQVAQEEPVEEPAEEPAAETPAEPTTDEDAVTAALEAATAASESNIPDGPPMTGSEREGFRVAVNGCWNVDPGSVAARVTVEVGFGLTQDGKVEGNNVRLISASGGDQSATDTAFQAARRAILRCQGSGGYQLPAEKYGQWKDVVITFDPSGMRLR